jgi:hypothetical protein
MNVRREAAAVRQRLTASLGSFTLGEKENDKGKEKTDRDKDSGLAAPLTPLTPPEQTIPFTSSPNGVALTAIDSRGLMASSDAVTYSTMSDDKQSVSSLSPDDHDVIIWLGDLNYRLSKDIHIDDAYCMINNMDIPDLASYDQLLQQKTQGRIFEGFKEGKLVFPPTYQFIPGTANYDCREQGKQRCPAWCDRILWRTGRGIRQISDSIRADRESALERYLSSNFAHNSSDEASGNTFGFGAGVVQAVRGVYDIFSAPFPTDSLQFLNSILNNVFVSDVNFENAQAAAVLHEKEYQYDPFDDPSIKMGSPHMNPMFEQLANLKPPTTEYASKRNSAGWPSNKSAIDDSNPSDSDEDAYDSVASDLRARISPGEAADLMQGLVAASSDPMNTSQDIAKVTEYIQSNLCKERVDLLYYNSCSKILISDHLPVRGLYQLQYKTVDWKYRECILANSIDALAYESNGRFGSASGQVLDAVTDIGATVISTTKTGVSFVVQSASWMATPFAESLFGIDVATINPLQGPPLTANSGLNSNPTPPQSTISVLNPILPTNLCSPESTQKQFLFGSLSPLSLIPSSIIFPVVECVQDIKGSRDFSKNGYFYAEVVNKVLEVQLETNIFICTYTAFVVIVALWHMRRRRR